MSAATKTTASGAGSAVTLCQHELRLVAELLSYPDEAWRNREAEYRAALDELPSTRAKAAGEALFDELDAMGAYAFEKRYVNAFDFNKETNLMLTSRGCSDELQQRTALLSYSTYFAESGFEADHESPDYLPAILELAASVDAPEAERIARGIAVDVTLLRDNLAKTDLSTYTELVDAAISVAGELAQAAQQEVTAK